MNTILSIHFYFLFRTINFVGHAIVCGDGLPIVSSLPLRGFTSAYEWQKYTESDNLIILCTRVTLHCSD